MPSSPKFPITDKQLLQALGITGDRLIDIEKFFDTHEEWTLEEGVHYKVLIQANDTRAYSYEGAHAIAKYLKKTEQKGFWESFIEWITGFKERLRRSLVKQRIVEVIDHPGKLVRMKNRYFITKRDFKEICGTSYPKLFQAFNEVQSSSRPLILDKEFADIDGVRYYSLAGIVKLSKNLGNTLTQVHRREWCTDVSAVADQTIRESVQWWEDYDKEIKRAMTRAKNP